MKKIMFALAAVAMAVGAQASSYNWKAATSYTYAPGDSTTKLASGTAYLFNAGEYSQAALLAAVMGGTSLADAYAANGVTAAPAGTVSAGQVALSADFTYNDVAAGSNWDAYFAVMSGDNLYISSTKNVTASALESPVTIAIGSQKTASQAAVTEWSAGDAFGGAGWYKAASSSGDDPAIPEPTSGLLMLVGLGALALRRRR